MSESPRRTSCNAPSKPHAGTKRCKSTPPYTCHIAATPRKTRHSSNIVSLPRRPSPPLGVVVDIGPAEKQPNFFVSAFSFSFPFSKIEPATRIYPAAAGIVPFETRPRLFVVCGSSQVMFDGQGTIGEWNMCARSVERASVADLVCYVIFFSTARSLANLLTATRARRVVSVITPRRHP